MFCPKCGANNPENSYYCKQCGYNFKAVDSYQNQNQNQNQIQTPTQMSNNSVKEEKLGVGLIALCILFPIVGIVGFFVWKKETPQKAKNALIISLIAWILWIVFLGN